MNLGERILARAARNAQRRPGLKEGVFPRVVADCHAERIVVCLTTQNTALRGLAPIPCDQG